MRTLIGTVLVVVVVAAFAPWAAAVAVAKAAVEATKASRPTTKDPPHQINLTVRLVANRPLLGYLEVSCRRVYCSSVPIAEWHEGERSNSSVALAARVRASCSCSEAALRIPPVSQERLAEMAGVHRTYVGHLELGRGSPTLDTIVRVAAALDVDPAELVIGLRPIPAKWDTSALSMCCYPNG